MRMYRVLRKEAAVAARAPDVLDAERSGRALRVAAPVHPSLDDAPDTDDSSSYGDGWNTFHRPAPVPAAADVSCAGGDGEAHGASGTSLPAAPPFSRRN